MNYKGAFMSELERRGIKYTDVNENRVSISYSGDNTNEIKINVIFDKDGDNLVALRCWSFGKVPANKRSAVIEACNSLNAQYRWVKFYIDDDGDVCTSLDAVVDISTVGAECKQLVSRMVDIYDKAYPTLMKACWA